jgi:Fur family ferric uptake transcriptional regulator
MLRDVPDLVTSEWAEHARGVLHRAGRHRGAAREELIELLSREDCALSAVDIEDALRAEGRRVARASIYRVLELLLEHDLVERVEVGDGVSRFERMLPSGEHHHHLVCDRCGRLVAFDDPALERAIHRVSSRLGARVNRHEVVLRGSCDECE